MMTMLLVSIIGKLKVCRVLSDDDDDDDGEDNDDENDDDDEATCFNNWQVESL